MGLVSARLVEPGNQLGIVRIRERVRNSFWAIPAFIIAATLLAGLGFRGFGALGPGPWKIRAESAEALLAAIATATLTFVAILFSVTIVALQLASQQMSPRVIRVFARSTLTKLTLGLFMGTFAFSISRLATLELSSNPDDASPALSVLLTVMLTFLSLGMFLAFANRIVRLMSVDRVIEQVASDTRSVIDAEFPPASSYVSVEEPNLGDPTSVIALEMAPRSLRTTRGTSGMLLGADRAALAHLASESGSILKVLPAVGSYVSHGATVIEIHGSDGPSEPEILSEIDIGSERNLRQDPMFGLRQLVDIAAQALSPAVNAPTTAVAVIDRLGDLLHLIGTRPPPTGYFADKHGSVLFIEPVPTWEEIVDLAFVELRVYGFGQPQVTRRLDLILKTLRAQLPESHWPALDHQLAGLVHDDTSPTVR